VHTLSQCCAEDHPASVDLAQAGVAAVLGDGGQAINPLDVVEFLLESLGHESTHGQPW